MPGDGDDSSARARDDQRPLSDGGAVGLGTVDPTDLDDAGTPFDAVRSSPPVAALLVGLVVVGGLLAYDAWFATGPLYAEWEPTRMDWLTLLAGVAAVAFGVVPAVRRPDRVAAVWSSYPKTPTTVVALAVVVAFVVVGAVAPALVPEPEIDLFAQLQPPPYMSIPARYTNECVGRIVGNHCYGSMQYPLGTTRGGENILHWALYGAGIAFQFALVTTAIMVPVAVAVGTAAGYFGGRVDSVLMGYVDVQAAVPAVVVYFVVILFTSPTLFALVLVFGLFSWEEMARSIRATVRAEKEEGYVMAARNAGAGPLTVLRRHVLPNVSGTVLTNVTNVVPKLIMIEALFAFLGLAGAQSYSWGRLIFRAVQSESFGGFGGGLPASFGDPIMLESAYWVAGVPALSIAVTVLALTAVGDALQRALDPVDDRR